LRHLLGPRVTDRPVLTAPCLVRAVVADPTGSAAKSCATGGLSLVLLFWSRI